MKIIKSDWIVLVGFLLFLTAHMTTNFLIKYYEDAAVTIGEASQVAHLMESNPLLQYLYSFNNFRVLFQFVMLPALFFGSYYFARKKYLTTNPELLESLAVTMLIIGLINATNDVSIMLGIVAGR